MSSPIYLTTAISYLNGNPHMGHKLEIVVTDILARYWEQNKIPVIFQTGTDEHGKKISDRAKSMDLKPIQLCDQKLQKFIQLYQSLGIQYDNFIRTSSPEHYKTVQHVFQILKEQGDIYLGKYRGWYSTREEKFITELQAEQMNYKDKVTGKPLEWIQEDSYFFKLSKFQEQIVKFYQDNPNFISNKQYYNQIMKRLQEPISDLSISRTNFKWGIPLDGEHVCYVWFDALLNYLTGIDYFELNPDNVYHGKGKTIWQNAYHVIGKDIIWFHGVIWTAMLMALNINLPRQLIIHGFVTDENGVKMSKSLGNVIDPFHLLQQFPVSTLRFYSIRYNNLENDSRCSVDNIIKFHNNELGNNIGNLVNRITNLIHTCCDSVVPTITQGDFNILDVSFLDNLEKLYETYSTRDISQLILDKFQELNLWLTEKAPWKMKDNIEERNKTLRLGIERLYQLNHLLIPIVPGIAGKIEELVGLPLISLPDLLRNSRQLNFGFDGLKLEKQKVILFPRIQVKKIKKEKVKKQKNKK